MTNLEFRTFRSKARLTQARVALRADVDRTVFACGKTEISRYAPTK